MSIAVLWTTFAKITYYEEIDFIDKKWTIKEGQYVFLHLQVKAACSHF